MMTRSIALIILLVFTFLNPIRIHAHDGSTPSLSLSPESITTSIDQTFLSSLIVDTAGQQAGGVGIKLQFDPSLLQVVSISTNPVFPDYPTQTFDNQKGSVVISGVVQNTSQLFSGKQTIAEIEWKAIQSGSTQISFLFEPNATTDSNIAVLTGTGDALDHVNTLSVTITDISAPESTINPDPLGSEEQNNTVVLNNTSIQPFQLPKTGVILFLFAFSLACNVYLLFQVRELRSSLKKLLKLDQTS